MIGKGHIVLSALTLLAFIASARGADAGATMQSTALGPHTAQVPPGFDVVSAGGRSAFCVKGNDSWVKAALADVAPATRPTTMPSDIENMVGQRRQELTGQMIEQLSLADRKAIDDLFDKKLLPNLRKIDAVNPKIYYLLATREQLADAMDAGWTDPRYHFIRFAHDVSYLPTATLSPDEPADDLVWWVEIHDGDNAATQRDALIAQVVRFENSLLNHNSMEGKNETEHDFEEFIHDNVFAPLKLPHVVDWFDFAGSTLFAIKYASIACGMDRQSWTEQLIGRPNQKRPYMQVDLINALDPAEIRPEYLMAYGQLLLLKGSVVFNEWLNRVGDDALARTLPAMRAHAPATAQALIDVVKKQTGFDLAPLMQPYFGPPSTQPAQ